MSRLATSDILSIHDSHCVICASTCRYHAHRRLRWHTYKHMERGNNRHTDVGTLTLLLWLLCDLRPRIYTRHNFKISERRHGVLYKWSRCTTHDSRRKLSKMRAGRRSKTDHDCAKPRATCKQFFHHKLCELYITQFSSNLVGI